MANAVDYKIIYNEKYGYEVLSKDIHGEYDIFLYDSTDNGNPVLRLSCCFDTLREALDAMSVEMNRIGKEVTRVLFPDGKIHEYLKIEDVG